MNMITFLKRAPNWPYWAWLLVAYGAAILGAMVLFSLAGCITPGGVADPVMAVVQRAVSDGVVTPQEVREIQAALPHQIDWPATIISSVASITGALGLVKIIPHRAFQGPFDQPTVPPQQQA